MLYERTALSIKPAEFAKLELEALREEDRMSPDLIFRGPYLLDSLGPKGAYQEKDLEAAILRDLEAAIMELSGLSHEWKCPATSHHPPTAQLPASDRSRPPGACPYCRCGEGAL